MKLKELRNRMKDRMIITVSAGVLAFSLIVTGVTCSVYAAKNDNNEKTTETADSEDEEDDAVSELFDNSSLSVEEKEIGKDESVYILETADGDVNQTIVSEHLYNEDGEDTIEDASTLSDIENVKGNETYSQGSGNSLTWNAEGNDIYYQGSTTAETPVTQKVTYYLDGKEVSAADLAGASGRVTIHFDYTNNTSCTETVDGKDYEVKIPFAAITALVLDDTATNVEVTNGKTQDTSYGNVVIGYALPGMTDSLQLEDTDLDDVEIPEEFEVSFDTENFSMDVCMTMVANAGSTVSGDGFSLDNLGDMVSELSTASDKLKDGSAELADGASTLADGLSTYLDGAEKINSGLKTLQSGAGTLTNGASQLNSGAAQLYSGLQTVNDNMESLTTGVSQLSSGASQVSSGLSTLSGKSSTIQSYMLKGIDSDLAQSDLNTDANDNGTADLIEALASFGVTGTKVDHTNAADILAIMTGDYAATIKAALTEAKYTAAVTGLTQAKAGIDAANALPTQISALSTGASQVSAGLTQTEAGVDKLSAGLDQLETGSKTLAKGTQSLVDKIPDLTSGIDQLVSGSNELVSNNDEILSGANQLSDGATELADGIVTFNEEGIDKIVDAYNGDVTDITNRLTAVFDAAEDYNGFAGAAEGVNVNTKFIYKLDAISADDAE